MDDNSRIFGMDAIVSDTVPDSFRKGEGAATAASSERTSAGWFRRKIKTRVIETFEIIKNTSVSPLGQFCFILVILYLVLSGCAADNRVMEKLDNIRVLPEEEKDSLRHPLVECVAATAETFTLSGFSVDHIEIQRDYGLVKAQRGETKMDCSLNALTEDLTRIRLKVHHPDLIADPEDDPEKIVGRIRSVLGSGDTKGWESLIRDMAKVHVHPDEQSPVLGYLSPGAEVVLFTDYEGASWSRLKLEIQGYGYIKNSSLEPPAP